MNKAKFPSFMNILTIALLCAGFSAGAQDPHIRPDSLYSTILQEERPIQVVLPEDYDPHSDQQYDILYVIDGISDFARMEWEFVRGEGFIPKNMIMVGIPNTSKGGIDHRDRDLTPTRTYPNSGGADQFLAFFKEELMPYIKNKYKAKASGHTLYGGSLGGLFVLYAFLKEPGLFTSYLAVDPSLWWDDFYVNKRVSKKLDSLPSLHNTIWLAGRTGAAYHFMGVAGMDSILQAKAPAGLEWKCTTYSNETHYSTQFKGLWDGLKFSYGGFYASTGGYPTSRKIAIKPAKGIILKDRTFPLICYNLNPYPYIHYSTDGSGPTRSSPSLIGEETPLTLSGSSKVIVKSFCIREEYDRADTGYFTLGSVLPAVPKPGKLAPGGLHYAYYEGNWDKWPDFSKLKPVRSGLTDGNFDLNKLSDQTNSIYTLDGWLEIPREGYYIFECEAGNGFKIFVAGQLLIDNKTGEGENDMVPLSKGFYSFRVEYFHKKGANGLNPVYVKPVDQDDFPIPAAWQYGRN